MRKPDSETNSDLKLYLVPCSCAVHSRSRKTTIVRGLPWGRYLKCPSCGKRHDPKTAFCNSAFNVAGTGKVDGCLGKVKCLSS